MSLGERLVELRKEKHLSQEEVAYKLNVTRQTVSKWETDASSPDFDKIMPLCELYGITSDELLTGCKEENEEKNIDKGIIDTKLEEEKKVKRVGGLAFSIFLYFVAVVWIMISIPALGLNPIISSGIFLLICGVATCIIIYTQLIYRKTKTPREEKNDRLYKQLESILSVFACIIYFAVSFATMAWHVTWLIWLIYALVLEIVKLLISIGGDKYE